MCQRFWNYLNTCSLAMSSFKKYGRGKSQRGFYNRFTHNKNRGNDGTEGFNNDGGSQGYYTGEGQSGHYSGRGQSNHYSGGRHRSGNYSGQGDSTNYSAQGKSGHDQSNFSGRDQGVQNVRGNKHPPHLRGKAIGMFYAKRGGGQKVPEKNRSNVQIDNERTAHLNSLLNAIESTNSAEFRNQGASFDMAENSFSQIYNEYLDENRLRNEGFHEVFIPDKQRLPRNPDLDEKLRNEFEKAKQTSQYQKMLHFRKKLPSFQMQNQILKLVEENQVVVLSGETGCGKTTQVPQFILDSYLETGQGSVCRIICTQPRRISAISVAERVAEERAERCGQNSSVGWQIRLEKKEPRVEGSMLYCTTGILLQWLKNDCFLGTVSHIVLDEIHERDLDTDFLMIILKDLLPRRPDLKLILMSATLNAEIFSKYFGRCPMINIPGYTFPVQEYLLEDVLEITGYIPNKDDSYIPKWKLKRMRNKTEIMEREDKEPFLRSLQGRYSPRTISTLRNWDENDMDTKLIVALLRHICLNGKEGAVLVFLTGWDQIRDVSRHLEENKYFSKGCLILPLHSLLPTVNQREIFDPPPRGVRKIILATNIAETSITIDDVVFVIDGGKMKMKSFDVENNVETLEPEFISLANAKQRRGRAGRVAAGICYHLYTKFREMSFDQYLTPEMLRTRLETLCLKIKILKLGRIKPFLEKAMNPPDPKSVDISIDLLKKLNALNEEECLTPLGFHLARLPMDPLTGRMILFGAIFSCLDPILTVAASLSFKDAFVTPFGMEKIVDQRKLEIAADLKSDHLMLAKAFFQWEQACHNGTDKEYCWENFLSVPTLKMLSKLKFQFASNLKDLHFLPDQNSKNPDFNIYSGNEMVLKAVLCAGLYPNVARVTRRVVGHKLKNRGTNLLIRDTRVAFHPKSVNVKTKVFPSEWVVYYQKMKSSEIYLYDTTMVYPYGLLFFGGEITMSNKNGKGTVTVDDWIVFNCSAETASIVKKLRSELDILLEYKIEHPEDNSWITNENSKEAIVVRSIIDLIVSEDDPNLVEELRNEKYNKKAAQKRKEAEYRTADF